MKASEIARKTLNLLAERRIAPTPENYQRVYFEISGEQPAENPNTAAISSAPDADQVLNWSTLIRELLKQLDNSHKGITIARKKQGVNTVLTRFQKDAPALYEKLDKLVHSWGAPQDEDIVDSTREDAQPDSSLPEQTDQRMTTELTASNHPMIGNISELLAETLESLQSTQPELTDEISHFAELARHTETGEQVTELAKQLRPFWIKVELRGGDKSRIHEGLVHLLRLLIENIGEMVEDEEWLCGQIAILQEIISNPIDKRTIADAEQNLRNAITQQSLLKDSMTDAKSTLKNLMATFIDRLGEITSSTGDYHQKIEGYSQQIKHSNNLPDLSLLLDDIMEDTQTVHNEAIRSHQELVDTQAKAKAAEERIKQLEQELAQVSEMVHQDQLTGALNRRGLDEAFQRETTRADRKHQSLCVALLDIDNFKRLNDSLGHHAGDKALVHLSKIIQEALRPSDYVARYGGEEFIILLPDIDLEEAAHTIERLQRELTKRYFMYEKDRVLITFSAGVARRQDNEEQQDLFNRADKAMYQAKKTGKNKVVIAS